MLTDKVVLITGGARGIGAGIARAMAGQGTRVALLDRDGPEAEKTAAGLTAPGLAVACDVAIEADVGAAVSVVVERFGGFDILVNNAGVGHPVGWMAGGHLGRGLGRATGAGPADGVRGDEGRGPASEGARWGRDRQHRLDHRPRGVAGNAGPGRREGRDDLAHEEPRAGLRSSRYPGETRSAAVSRSTAARSSTPPLKRPASKQGIPSSACPLKALCSTVSSSGQSTRTDEFYDVSPVDRGGP